MKKTTLLLCAGIVSAGVAFAADVDLSKLPAPSTKKGLTFAKDIKPLFEASCIRCHGEERQKADLRLDSLEAVLKGGENGKVVVAGKSKESPLVIAVSGLDPEHAMPPKRKRGGPGGPGGGGPGGPGGPPGREGKARPAGPGGGGPGGPGGGPGGPGGFAPPKDLTADEVGLLRAWIDQGAK